MKTKRNNFYKIIDKYISQYENILSLDKLVDSPENTIIINQANQSLKSIFVTRSFEYLQKNVFVITKDDKIAEEIAEDLSVLTDDQNVYFVPDYETLPYEERSPHYMIRAIRIRAISNLLSKEKAIYCLSFKNLVRNIINPLYVKENILRIKISEEIDMSELILYLTNCGYEHATQIEKVGQFSKRGGILDIFSPNYRQPLRLEFWGDEVISIRSFSVETQRSERREVDGVSIIPAREVILGIETKNSILSEKVAELGFYEGIELDIPLLYQKKHSLFDYTTPDSSIFFFDNLSIDFDILDDYQEEINELYKKASQNNKKRVFADPSNVLLSKAEIECIQKNYPTHHLNSGHLYVPLQSAMSQTQNTLNISLHSEPSPFFNSDLMVLEEHIKTLKSSGFTIFIQLENEAQKNRMMQLLDNIISDVHFTIGVLHKGFIFHDTKLAVFTDHEIFKRVKHKKLDAAFSKGEALVDYESLKPGDFIVHIEHGIGIYEGIKILNIGEKKIECLCIQYAGTDKVYVPTWQLNLVAKYVSEEGNAPLIHKLGTKTWETTKQKARKSIELVVEDIVNLYAERKLRKGISFKPDTDWQREMEESFIYDDTPDQITATTEIKDDMEKDTPMERLLCGDVGFGKTEVAIRIAFKAVMSDFQVAVVVPTTLLAEQHFHVFRERLALFPINIAMLSRFRSTAEINRDIHKLKTGEIDIVIGTHRLFSKDVIFKKIGLLIIDEEHRFGVKHKDRIRQIKSNIDTLYMSATPIPRTMNMILSKLKAMSLIQTSPKARLPIRTVIVHFDHEIIKDAIQREIDRGGQIYFVHNRIDTIESIYIELRNLMPNLRIVIGHGQLMENQLEKVFSDFAAHKYDVLLATTIIESGIDIPNANTIIINRADMFGLAQLYQIRGRVGRSNKRAYAYLMIPKHLNDTARKRLETLTEYESLGAGYQIAMRDLEIRGAGTLLGTKQSGVITSVGFNFYNRLLELAVKNILEKNPKGLWDESEEKEELRKIELGIDFYFPPDFINDEKQKLQIYKRIVAFENEKDFDDLAIELKDRYGSLPVMAKNVIDYFKMRWITKTLGLKSFMILSNKMYLEYDGRRLPPRKLLGELMAFSEVPMSFDVTNGLKIVFDFAEDMAIDKQRKISFAMNIISILNKEN